MSDERSNIKENKSSRVLLLPAMALSVWMKVKVKVKVKPPFSLSLSLSLYVCGHLTKYKALCYFLEVADINA